MQLLNEPAISLSETTPGADLSIVPWVSRNRSCAFNLCQGNGIAVVTRIAVLALAGSQGQKLCRHDIQFLVQTAQNIFRLGVLLLAPALMLT